MPTNERESHESLIEHYQRERIRALERERDRLLAELAASREPLREP